MYLSMELGFQHLPGVGGAVGQRGLRMKMLITSHHSNRIQLMNIVRKLSERAFQQAIEHRK